MARMVFGNWATGDGRKSVMHYATERLERGYRTACNRTVSIVTVFTPFAITDEAERLDRGQRVTSCKSCRRQMGWPVMIAGKVLNGKPVGRPLIEVLAGDAE